MTVYGVITNMKSMRVGMAVTGTGETPEEALEDAKDFALESDETLRGWLVIELTAKQDEYMSGGSFTCEELEIELDTNDTAIVLGIPVQPWFDTVRPDEVEILDFIQKNPGCATQEISLAVQLGAGDEHGRRNQNMIRIRLQRLARNGHITIDKTGIHTYWPVDRTTAAKAILLEKKEVEAMFLALTGRGGYDLREELAMRLFEEHRRVWPEAEKLEYEDGPFLAAFKSAASTYKLAQTKYLEACQTAEIDARAAGVEDFDTILERIDLATARLESEAGHAAEVAEAAGKALLESGELGDDVTEEDLDKIHRGED